MNRRRFSQVVAAGMASGAGFPQRASAAGESVGWPYHQGDPQATRYSPLTQINAANAGLLKPAWVHHSAAAGTRARGTVECTPVVAGGVMYIVGADLVIQALDAATGKLIWSASPLAGAA